eukprot:gnl/TRDRNA2_/TRDRNA2_66651_c0_seq1.p1 gnl/TRDRNA2_/TRDRNA2_66651_c0~~gnl/TRDRNA2_/TRDRNA2_66651_c0_seq1.p1  ORF type:complete len:357 (-),score=40.66 gnl/TRDRNA2_/TRDRNA2_66651_c0_seq1:120-1190(-)
MIYKCVMDVLTPSHEMKTSGVLEDGQGDTASLPRPITPNSLLSVDLQSSGSAAGFLHGPFECVESLLPRTLGDKAVRVGSTSGTTSGTQTDGPIGHSSDALTVAARFFPVQCEVCHAPCVVQRCEVCARAMQGLLVPQLGMTLSGYSTTSDATVQDRELREAMAKADAASDEVLQWAENNAQRTRQHGGHRHGQDELASECRRKAVGMLRALKPAFRRQSAVGLRSGYTDILAELAQAVSRITTPRDLDSFVHDIMGTLYEALLKDPGQDADLQEAVVCPDGSLSEFDRELCAVECSSCQVVLTEPYWKASTITLHFRREDSGYEEKSMSNLAFDPPNAEVGEAVYCAKCFRRVVN